MRDVSLNCTWRLHVFHASDDDHLETHKSHRKKAEKRNTFKIWCSVTECRLRMLEHHSLVITGQDDRNNQGTESHEFYWSFWKDTREDLKAQRCLHSRTFFYHSKSLNLSLHFLLYDSLRSSFPGIRVTLHSSRMSVTQFVKSSSRTKEEKTRKR